MSLTYPIYSLTPPILRSGVVGAQTIRTVIRQRLTVLRIKTIVAEFYDIHVSEMVSDRRNWSVARPRQIAMYLTRELTPKSLPDIGRLFGGRDHTTVMHAIKRVEALCEVDGDFAEDVAALRERLAA